jgi:hypothetical protein
MNVAYPNAGPVATNSSFQTSKDESDLRMLSVFHYVWSALIGCSSLGIVGYFLIIAGAIASAPTHGENPQNAEAAGAVTAGVGVVFGLVMVVLFILHLLAAAGLKKKTRYGLAMAMSAMACLSVPLGTALGVWTMMVLQRPSVKALFGR